MIPASKPRLLSFLAATLVAGAGSRVAQAEDWATPGLDAAHGRLSAERAGTLFADGRWSARTATGGRILASPVVADGILVSVDLRGVVRGLRADDGQLVWQVALAAPVHGTPAVAGGRVFVPTLANSVVALRLADGASLWSKPLAGMTSSSPTPVDGDIVVSVGVPGKTVVRLSGATGATVWETAPIMEQFGNTSPAVGGGLVVAGSNGGRYYAFDAATGELRWQYVGDGIVHLAAPIIAGGRVYMAGGNDSDRVHAVDAATGAALAGWPIALPSPAPDVAGRRIARQRAVSSFASVGGLLLLQTRLDDALDVNADGSIDKTLSRESVIAIDPASGAIAWQMPRARAEIADPNHVPKFFTCPTPAGFAADGGGPLAAVASSLDATVVVLDAASGAERARHKVAGPALASPVLANGRLLVAAMNGTVEGLASSFNHAPAAAIAAGSARALDAAHPVLRWLPATDPDAELPSYELRIDTDGEVLQSWQHRILLSAGTTSTRLPDGLAEGVTYTFSLRARDGRGALSPWSRPETFTVVVNPSVTVGGNSVGSLADALSMARPGDVVTLGTGSYRLTDTMRVNGGITVQGAGAGRTLIDASGLSQGVSLEGTADGRGAAIDGVTVTGAETCIRVASAATRARISHVIARACRVDAVEIAPSGEVAMANVTLVGNGTGVHARGAATIKNSLLAQNQVGLATEAGGTLVSTFNNVFDNPIGYRGLDAGTGDLSKAVSFADFGQHDLRILVTQPSTDRGDPADAVGAEPTPNGGRINLGAFGGTADAEASLPSTAVGDPAAGTSGPTPTWNSTSTPPGETPPPTGADEAGGCSLAGAPPASGGSLLALLGLLIARRRRR